MIDKEKIKDASIRFAEWIRTNKIQYEINPRYESNPYVFYGESACWSIEELWDKFEIESSLYCG